ncbi:hypothetical protein [Streptomyces olivaceus]
MITSCPTTRSGVDSPGDRSRELQLRSALQSLHRTTSRFTGRTPSGIARDREAVWAAVDRWLPLAQQRQREAEASPSDQARWHEILQAVRRPQTEEDDRPAQDMVLFVSAARRLLRALLEAERLGPNASAVADRVRRDIRNGVHSPGSTLGLHRIAESTAAPTLERVELALQDLQGEGLVTISPGRHTRVTGGTVHASRPQQIAAWLFFLIRSGVYPPGTHLPPLLPLSRSLVSSVPDTVSALRLLTAQKVLLARPGRRRAVCTAQPVLITEPPGLQDLVDEMRRRAAPNQPQPTPVTVLTACKQTHVWWSRRAIPNPQELDDRFKTLTTACANLVAQALDHSPGPDVQAALRQAAVTALAEHPADVWERTWRAASLGALVRNLPLLILPPRPTQQTNGATATAAARHHDAHQLGPST